MLNYETLLSTYDDKLTLMQWLKKVEAALKDASAVSFNVNKRGNATITFSVVFEDGSELESNPIILQQGESVTNAAITNGHLILTLSNGDSLDAGNTGAVSGFFINAAQHLIVQYQDGTTNDLGAIFNGSITINGDIAATGDISGNIPVLTCSAAEIVAQKPVVETMAGYGFRSSTISTATKEDIYAGIVKNGNKLTLVYAFNVTPNTATNINLAGLFDIPSAIADLLMSTTIDGNACLQAFNTSAKNDLTTTGANLPAWIYKTGDSIGVTLNFGSLSTGVKYYIRIEATLLLSQNLAE